VGGMGVEGLVGMITGVEVLGGKRKRLDECNGDLTSTDNSFRVADKPSLMFSPRAAHARLGVPANKSLHHVIDDAQRAERT
jgi:hypothetical protein